MSAVDTGGNKIVRVGHYVAVSPPDRIGVRRANFVSTADFDLADNCPPWELAF